MKETEWMRIESLECLDTKVKQMIYDDDYTRKPKSNEINFGSFFPKTKINKNNFPFPILRLPIDIIHNTALFLDKKDIFTAT